MIKGNKFSIITSLVIIYLSLANAKTFENVGFFDVPYLDKFVHLCLYFGFTAVIILEHRNFFVDTRRLILIALIPILFGGLMELMQGGFTTTRKADLLDMIFNSAGTAAAVFIWLVLNPYYKKDIK